MDRSDLSSGTVTKLLKELHTGNELVVQQIFNFYFQRLANRARTLLKDMGGVRISNEEDLASLVMTAFLQDATAGEIGDLRSRHDVWRMLSKRIKLRAINMVRDERRLKRAEVGESAFRNVDGAPDPQGIQQQSDRGSDELIALHRELLEELQDDVEVQIVKALLEGDSVQEIAESVGKSTITIYRKLKKIKNRWIKLNAI
jgi:DNA-directed RNA polymerase specialized sigma24 family protein